MSETKESGKERAAAATMLDVREVLAWLPVGLIPIANGVLRMMTYQVWLAEPWSSLLSSTLDVTFIVLYANWLEKKRPHRRPAFRGLVWVILSTLNHFLLGLALFGLSLADLLSKYAIMRGETWLLISASILVAPSVAAKLVGLSTCSDPNHCA